MRGREQVRHPRPKALILEDLKHYPAASIGQINKRIGEEINSKRLKRAIDQLIEEGQVRFEGERKARRYWIVG